MSTSLFTGCPANSKDLEILLKINAKKKVDTSPPLI